MVRQLKLIAGLCWLSPFFAATAAPLPHSMAALGDSITAGAIADYSLDSWKKPTHIYGLLKKLKAMAENRNAEVFERKDLSWTAGHARKLKIALARRGEDWNFSHWNGATSGHTVSDVVREQLPQLLRWSRQELNQGAPDYVTLLIGANDLCNQDINKMTETFVFRARVEQIVATLLGANPQAKILISEVPDVERVWRIARNHQLSSINGVRTCAEVWKQMPFCANLLTTEDPAQRLRMRQRAEEYNAVLDTIKANYDAKFPDHLRIAHGIYASKFELTALSADCFHPNIKGQALLSDISWPSTWWAD